MPCKSRTGQSSAIGPRITKCRLQHDPAAHARTHQDLSPLGQRIEDRRRIFSPSANSAKADVAARGAVAEIVKAHKGAAAAAAKILEIQRLGAGHVGAEAAEENNPRG